MTRMRVDDCWELGQSESDVRLPDAGLSRRGVIRSIRRAMRAGLAMPDAGDIILITGASGFVGSAIAIAARRGAIAFVSWCAPRAPRGNIQPATTWSSRHPRPRLARGGVARCALSDPCGRRLSAVVAHASEIITTNAEGTRCVMEEALRAGVERIVYTSSVATIALRDDMPADESSPLSEHDAIAPTRKAR